MNPLGWKTLTHTHREMHMHTNTPILAIQHKYQKLTSQSDHVIDSPEHQYLQNIRVIRSHRVYFLRQKGAFFKLEMPLPVYVLHNPSQIYLLLAF